MPDTPPLTDAHGEVRELTDEDFARLKPARETLPESLHAKLGVRGRQKAPTKVLTSIRLSPEVVESFRASGDGWQTRIDTVLVNWLKRHKPEEVDV